MIHKIQEYIHHIDEHTKNVLDFTSIGVVLGSIMQILPAIASIFTIVWTGIRIYETRTVQSWLKKKKTPNA